MVDAVSDQLKCFGLGHSGTPLDLVLPGRRRRPLKPAPAIGARASVVRPIEGFNGLLRFVQHSRQRCNAHYAGADVDPFHHLADGGDEHLASWAGGDVDVIRAGL